MKFKSEWKIKVNNGNETVILKQVEIKFLPIKKQIIWQLDSKKIWNFQAPRRDSLWGNFYLSTGWVLHLQHSLRCQVQLSMVI